MNVIKINFKDFFHELKSNFDNGNIIEQLKVDIHRLYIYFYLDNIPNVNKRLCRVKNFKELIFLLYSLDNYYNTKLYFIAYICNQCIFHQTYKHILNVTSQMFDGSYLLDCDASEKTIKIHFSINSIFINIFGKFDLVYINSDTFEKNHIYYVIYNLSFFFEYDKKLIIPQNIYLHYIMI